ncbi:hypothetical protein EWI61_02920 [Methylolobus aquaticus]|nr:hypothetical protein EWI61_02920 [Methylolobus aquaticus]
MSTSDWIALLSAAATLLSTIVAFVALWKQLQKVNLQLQLQNQQLQLQQFADYTKRYQEIVFRFPEEINESTFQLKDHQEYRSIMRCMRSYFDLSFEEWQLHKRGYLDSATWDVWRGGMKTALSKTAFRQAWAVIKQDTRFGPDFESFLADLGNASQETPAEAGTSGDVGG